MNFLCNTCDIHTDMENYRIMLNGLALKKNYKLIDDEIINLSEALDVLVYKCIFCDQNLNNIFKLNLRNIFGTHSSFY